MYKRRHFLLSSVEQEAIKKNVPGEYRGSNNLIWLCDARHISLLNQPINYLQ